MSNNTKTICTHFSLLFKVISVIHIRFFLGRICSVKRKKIKPLQDTLHNVYNPGASVGILTLLIILKEGALTELKMYSG